MRGLHSAFLLRKIPSHARSLIDCAVIGCAVIGCAVIGCAVICVSPQVSAAQAPTTSTLTERQVVVRALQRAPLGEMIEAAVDVERGHAGAAGAYPNPQLAYMREQTFGPAGTGEDYLSIAQTLDLGGRRALRGEAGDARARAAGHEGDALRVMVAADARLRFYEVLHRQSRVVALDGWIARIDEALAIVARREERGDAARYDRRRLERERIVAAGRRETERAALARADARLRAIVGAGRTLTLSGTLLPETDPASLATQRVAVAARPDLLALDQRIEAAALESTAAARWWAPELRIEGGWKGLDLGRQGRSDGFLLGASLSIPFWDQSSGLARVAVAETRAARGRRGLIEEEVGAELGAVRADAVRLRRAAIDFRAESSAASGDVVRIASAGYAGGELGLLELLDAYRGAAEDSLSALEMEHAARHARIELDRMTGAGVP